MVFIGAGFILLARIWPVFYSSQREHRLATTGPYARIRYPQYPTFILVMFKFLLQWPTTLTAAMFPLPIFMYMRLARIEEKEACKVGEAYTRYAAISPAFIPRFGKRFSGSPIV